MYDDDQDELAAEYVLGTLNGDEREQAKALLAIDAGFAAVVRSWERRLGELNVMVEAVEPPSNTWDRIKASVGGVQPLMPQIAPAEFRFPVIEEPQENSVAAAFPSFTPPPGLAAPVAASAPVLPPPPLPPTAAPTVAAPPVSISGVVAPPVSIAGERSADVVRLARRVRRWRRGTLFMTAVAASLALFIAAAQYVPDLIPTPWRLRIPRLIEMAKAPTPTPTPAQTAGPLIAVLQQEPGAPAFLLSVNLQTRMLTIRRVSAPKEANRSYELWLVSKAPSAPHSLGVVGVNEFTQRAIPSNYDADTVDSATYAVSLEPAGGSPSGAPTGPVLFKGSLFQSVPTPGPAPAPAPGPAPAK
jgi:anti-sigma-K factor RskA